MLAYFARCYFYRQKVTLLGFKYTNDVFRCKNACKTTTRNWLFVSLAAACLLLPIHAPPSPPSTPPQDGGEHTSFSEISAPPRHPPPYPSLHPPIWGGVVRGRCSPEPISCSPHMGGSTHSDPPIMGGSRDPYGLSVVSAPFSSPGDTFEQPRAYYWVALGRSGPLWAALGC